MQFNPAKPHGRIVGDDSGACFEQDGHLFDSTGELLTQKQVASPASLPDDKQAEVVAKRRGRPPAEKPSPVDEQLAAQIGG